MRETTEENKKASLLRENHLKSVQPCLQELKNCPPRNLWNVLHIVPQVQLRNGHLVFLRGMNINLFGVLIGEDEKEWKLGIESELDSLEEKKIWEPCVLPVGRNAIPVKWIFKEKFDPEGIHKGFMQREEVDILESFAPVAKFASVTSLIVIAAFYNLKLIQMDVTTEFRNPDVKEDMY
jgi:hypothetical protein